MKAMMEEITKEKLTLDLESTTKAYKLFYKRFHPIKSKNLLFFSVFCLIIGVLLSLLTFKTNKSDFMLGIFLVILSFYYFYRYSTMYKRMAKHHIKCNSQNYTYKINEEGYSAISNEHNSSYKWDYFKEYKILNDMIVLFDGKYSFVVFPKVSYTDLEFDLIKKWIINKSI